MIRAYQPVPPTPHCKLGGDLKACAGDPEVDPDAFAFVRTWQCGIICIRHISQVAKSGQRGLGSGAVG